jgi:hypothetical protein
MKRIREMGEMRSTRPAPTILTNLPPTNPPRSTRNPTNLVVLIRVAGWVFSNTGLGLGCQKAQNLPKPTRAHPYPCLHCSLIWQNLYQIHACEAQIYGRFAATDTPTPLCQFLHVPYALPQSVNSLDSHARRHIRRLRVQIQKDLNPPSFHSLTRL